MKFSKDERKIMNLFKKEDIICNHKVVLIDKPTTSKGEPKTDIFIRLEDQDTLKIKDIKISFKKANADFLENKISKKRAYQIFGEEWSNIIFDSLLSIKDKFKNTSLIYKEQNWPTRAGSITLGWKFELLNKPAGLLSGKLSLTKNQLKDIYAGTNLSASKKNAFINGEKINNSGVANFMLHGIADEFNTPEDVLENLMSIDDYIQNHKELYFGCKALNYRSFKDKYDGNRPLSVYVDWAVKNNKLTPTLIFNKPLEKKGNEVANKLKKSLDYLNIKNTDDINASNCSSTDYIYN